ncbi:MAG: glycosyltransferase family 2 protein [Faecalibacterium prausnitzii]
MKATIIIPNINGKGWLKDSIESVYAQTEQDFELIVVDNGSTDESLEQARSYCSRPNFQLIENGSNTGFSHAVNQGIARAKSEFVVLFNNDAFAEPQWLAELIRVAESDPKDLRRPEPHDPPLRPGACRRRRRLRHMDGLCLQDRRWPPGQPVHKAEAHLLGLRRRGPLPQEHPRRDRRLR